MVKELAHAWPAVLRSGAFVNRARVAISRWKGEVFIPFQGRYENEGVTTPSVKQYVWTVAGNSWIERLKRREMYRRPWRESAGYESDSPWSMAHRRAYLWMAAQFAKRKGRRLQCAPPDAVRVV